MISRRRRRIAGTRWAFGAALGAALFLLPRRAHAVPDEVTATADEVTLDARQRELELRGNVRVDASPFHITSDALKLKRTEHGVEVDGAGRMAFCPCLGTPFAVRFERAIVAPPGDLVLMHPRLEFYRVPIAYLPAFWLRSPARFGVLPPDIAYRARDGMFLGGGVHLPWRFGDATQGLDLSAGWYSAGGHAIDATLRTPASTTRLRWDRRAGDGLLVDARGAMATGSSGHVAWDVDALAGPRAVVATSDLRRATLPTDRGSLEAWSSSDGWSSGVGMRRLGWRGADLADPGAVAPIAFAMRDGALGERGHYDLSVATGAVRTPSADTVAFGRSEGGVSFQTHSGPIALDAGAHASGNAAQTPLDHDLGGAASVHASAGLPLVRAFGSADASDPWRHRIAPAIGARALAASAPASAIVPHHRSLAIVRGHAWAADGTLGTDLGRWGVRKAISLWWRGGVIGDAADVLGASSARIAGELGWVALSAQAAVTADPSARAQSGRAGSTNVRVGKRDGLRIGVNAAHRSGVDPAKARLLEDSESSAGLGYVARSGWTGGAGLVVPWSRLVSTLGRVDMDLESKSLIAARAGVEIRDRCDCLALRLVGANRMGREGVDVWLGIDFAPGIRRRR